MAESDLGEAGAALFERKLVTHTYEGLYVRPLYSRSDWPAADAGASGSLPLTRGGTPLSTAVHGWDIRQERAESDLARVKSAITEDLSAGVTSVVLRLDACGRMGLDPRSAQGASLVGCDGIAAYTLDDLDTMLDGVYLNMIGVHLEAGAAFVSGAGALAALWDRRGISPRDAVGGFNADPLAVLARDGSLPYSLEVGLDRLAGLARWTSSRYVGVTSVRVGTAPYHHAGATASQDLAFSMATGLEYLRAMTRGGMRVDDATRQVVFSYAVGCGTFLAIAKLRAARRLWARVVEVCGGSADARRMRMYVRPSRRVLTTRDVWMNMLRSAACVYAAGLAGADAIGCTPFDATLGEPSADGRRLARNTHHILMEECGLHRVCDATGGSFYVERLTDELAEAGWAIFQAIERRGGMAAAVSSGWVGEQIDQAQQPRARDVATRKVGVVGVSEFPSACSEPRAAAPIDREKLVLQVRSRLEKRLGASGDLPRTVRSGDGPAHSQEMASAGATIDEIESTLELGQTPAILTAAVHTHSYSEPFEHLRDSSDAYAAVCGHRPRVFLCALGPSAKRQARVNFCRNLFESGGFEVLGGEGDGSPSSVLADFQRRPTGVAVVCGPDEAYITGVPATAMALHSAGAKRVVLAGNPGALESVYREAGIDRFVFVKCDVVALLRELLAEEGAPV